MPTFEHTMSVPSEVWEFFQKHTGMKNPSRPLRDILQREMTALQQNGIRPAALLELCEMFDLNPAIFDPEPNDEEQQHIKQKKRMLIRGYRCEGMQSPERTLSFIIRDIQDHIPWDDLGPSGQAAYRALTDKYRQWVFQQSRKIANNYE